MLVWIRLYWMMIVGGDEEIWEKPKKEKPIEKKEMVKNINGKQVDNEY